MAFLPMLIHKPSPTIMELKLSTGPMKIKLSTPLPVALLHHPTNYFLQTIKVVIFLVLFIKIKRKSMSFFYLFFGIYFWFWFM